MDKETYLKATRKQKRNKQTSLCCVECGEDDLSVIEMHHVYGRCNSDETIPLCKSCHFKTTAEQNKVSPKKRSKKAKPIEQRGFWFISVGALLRGIGDQLLSYGHELMKHD
ncbi:HNH endonuclease signature motif containing protein [Methanohalophilus halophilus]|uniref:HNH endonuclease n=1 Tax=Methanohalophilus halophilus TaxID=2177 RepID=A0A1L3Q034_9EURY|nr:HNH endonuclease [Methanohalophilus halophilus]APH38232.1 HNH endonuclease [Methanohalophilus halophilus]RNI10901.1 HNH endonuclease [Methanohalophilus halophilus]SDV99901.1 hypothetical protein SAMN04515625_0059 [Methanohalophilus halophilus]